MNSPFNYSFIRQCLLYNYIANIFTDTQVPSSSKYRLVIEFHIFLKTATRIIQVLRPECKLAQTAIRLFDSIFRLESSLIPGINWTEQQSHNPDN